VPPPRKYEPDGGPGMRQILDLLKASDEPEADQSLFLKAQIVFWLLGATDGHAKNFSIFLLPGGRFRRGRSTTSCRCSPMSMPARSGITP
jgi:serine/threonine-protein kinase HipA